MRFTFAAVGKLKSKHFAAACHDYTKRLGRYANVDLVEIKDVRNRPPTETAERESRALEEAAPKGAFVVVLDERGDLVSSMDLARRIEDAGASGRSSWTFCLGGAEGHDPEFRKRADWVWSLSPLTLPHELARVVMLEQVYRAMTIIRGERYHREG